MSDLGTGTFTIDTTTNTKTCNISFKIPQQTIYLRGVRVEFDTAAHALATRIVYIDLPFFSQRFMIDTNPSYTYLPVLLDNAVVTVHWGQDVPITLNDTINERFEMRVLGTDFLPVANLVSCSLQFSLSTGSDGL